LDQETLIRLIDRLDRYPIGLPDSPEIREFLSLFLSADEALLASKFPLREATAQEMAERTGWPEERAAGILESLALKGAVLDFPMEGERYWLLSPSVVGFVEFSLMKVHAGIPIQRLAELLERYTENELWKEVFGSTTPPVRALVGADIPVTSRAMTYAQVVEVVRSSKRFAFQTCFCRNKERLLGRPCQAASHEDTCMALGLAADFVIRRGFGREASAEELLARVRELGRKGLIHITDNVRDKPGFICNCCGCCCGLLAGIRRMGLKNAVAPTPLLLAVDPGKCSGCGACAKTCQIQAVEVREKKAHALEERCLGCGSCLRVCPAGALSLKERAVPPDTPKDSATKFVRIAKEKGRLWPLLREGWRSKLRKLA